MRAEPLLEALGTLGALEHGLGTIAHPAPTPMYGMKAMALRQSQLGPRTQWVLTATLGHPCTPRLILRPPKDTRPSRPQF